MYSILIKTGDTTYIYAVTKDAEEHTVVFTGNAAETKAFYAELLETHPSSQLVVIPQILCSYSYSKKCIKCIESAEKDKTCYPAISCAWRDFGTPIIHKDGKAYATYRCQYGHSFLVDLSE